MSRIYLIPTILVDWLSRVNFEVLKLELEQFDSVFTICGYNQKRAKNHIYQRQLLLVDWLNLEGSMG